MNNILSRLKMFFFKFLLPKCQLYCGFLTGKSTFLYRLHQKNGARFSSLSIYIFPFNFYFYICVHVLCKNCNCQGK